MIKKPKTTPKYEFKSIDILEQACALWRVEPDREKAAISMKYHYTKEPRYEYAKRVMPIVQECDKQLAQDILEYFKKYMFMALSDSLTKFQGVLYDALYTDVIYYQQLKALSLAPYIYQKDIKDDEVDEILKRTTGKLFSKADSPITRTIQVLTVDFVQTASYGDFWAYTAITDDDYFVKFTQNGQICDAMHVFKIAACWKGTELEYRTGLPVTKLFRVKKQ